MKRYALFVGSRYYPMILFAFEALRRHIQRRRLRRTSAGPTLTTTTLDEMLKGLAPTFEEWSRKNNGVVEAFTKRQVNKP